LLSEVLYVVKGCRHGFSWWINDDQRTVYIERHWRNGELHGIEREWESSGALTTGFPKFFLSGRQVQLPEYVDAVSKDSTLPAYAEIDNSPTREFPKEIRDSMTVAHNSPD